MKTIGLILFIGLLVGLFAQAMVRLFLVDPVPALIIPAVLAIIVWGLWAIEDF